LNLWDSEVFSGAHVLRFPYQRNRLQRIIGDVDDESGLGPLAPLMLIRHTLLGPD
jgi:hypothetical protein